jgi:branched-chain amino acid transport system substrate-binding protein
VDAINKAGGIDIGGKKMQVRLKFVDTESNPTKASELASQLILQDKVDLMIVSHTPDTTNPVAATCERYQIPCLSVDTPVDAWLTGGPYKWSYHAFWTVDTICDVYMDMWEKMMAKDSSIKKTVGYIFPNDADGKAWSELFTKKLTAKGYKVVDPGRWPVGTKDFNSLISKFKSEGVDIVCGTLITPDFVTVWRQMHQQGFVPKVATIGKAVLFPADAAALGENLAEGVCVELWWSPFHPFKSSINGETAKELADAYTKESGKPWNATLGYKYANVEIAADVLKRAGSLDKQKIADAAAKTQFDSIIGPIKYNDQHFSETPLVGAQWHKAANGNWEVTIISNSKASNIPTGGQITALPK